ncbi:MAG: hypothetical protein ACRDHM_06970 [Actinomycetota bacterium]
MEHRSALARVLVRLSVGLLAALVLVAPASAKSSKAKNDRDRMPNGWEKKHGLNVRVNDAREDPDADQLPNIAEFKNRTDPQDADSDDDGFSDGAEVLDGFDPADPEDNLDADGEEVGEELGDDTGAEEEEEEELPV